MLSHGTLILFDKKFFHGEGSSYSSNLSWINDITAFLNTMLAYILKFQCIIYSLLSLCQFASLFDATKSSYIWSPNMCVCPRDLVVETPSSKVDNLFAETAMFRLRTEQKFVYQ